MCSGHATLPIPLVAEEAEEDEDEDDDGDDDDAVFGLLQQRDRLRSVHGCRGYGYPWIYPCVDIRLRPYQGYIHR